VQSEGCSDRKQPYEISYNRREPVPVKFGQESAVSIQKKALLEMPIACIRHYHAVRPQVGHLDLLIEVRTNKLN